MRDARKVYEQFDLIHRNKEKDLTKVTYSSLDKYSKSPYLQRVVQPTIKKQNREVTPSQPDKKEPMSSERKVQSNTKYQLPKLVNPTKFKEGELIGYFKADSATIEGHLISGKKSIGSHSATLEVNHKKAKLQPIGKSHRLHFASKTKAGTTGKQTKINQDIAIVEMKLPFGIKLFCVCDGHGVNGHLVSAYIKSNLLKNLNGALKKIANAPATEDLKNIMKNCLIRTNKQLLECDIETQLSGSTVVAVLLFGKKILSFNVGDSRAVLAKSQPSIVSSQNSEKEEGFSKRFSMENQKVQWKIIPLSIDQKPERPDEAERVINNGGRIFAQKNEKGEDLGPLRVWMKEIMMPGLAMTRSFGDKAGLKAGTCADAEILEFDLTEDDKFMVVASDGIWQYLQSDEVIKMVAPFYLKDDLDMACERLVRISSQIWQKVSYSRDDITIIVVSLNPPI